MTVSLLGGGAREVHAQGNKGGCPYGLGRVVLDGTPDLSSPAQQDGVVWRPRPHAACTLSSMCDVMHHVRTHEQAEANQ
eukprot:314704-Chlamydomonas_euryale.AAC.2